MKMFTMFGVSLTMMALVFTTLFAPMASAATGDTTIMLGCEVADMGGYLNKVDATCQFKGFVPGSRVYGEGDVNDGGVVFVADDLDPTTSLTRTVTDN